MWNAYDNHHTVTRLEEVVHLRLKVRRCVNADCARLGLTQLKTKQTQDWQDKHG